MSRYLNAQTEAALLRRLGRTGPAQLAALDARVEDLAARWGLHVDEPLAGGARSCVLAARRGRQQLVLKLAVGDGDVADEVAALRAFEAAAAGQQLPAASPRIREVAPGAVLMDRVLPGGRARPALPPAPGDVDAASAVLRVVAGTAALPDLPALPDATDILTRRCRQLPAMLAGTGVPDASVLAAAAAAGLEDALGEEPAAGRAGVCHGDLWRGNMLAGPGRWLLLDPYGRRGPVEVDAVLWAVTVGWGEGYEEWAAGLCAALGLDRDRFDRLAVFWAAERVAVQARMGYDPMRVARLRDLLARLEPLLDPARPRRR